ncbi:MAG: hypothetical protein ACXVF2_20465 [Blastococcus sp.]
MSKTITTRNESGQVASFEVTGPLDPVAQILQQRIARGELEVVDGKTKSAAPNTRGAVEDVHTGMVDEKGDYLKSIHGGGADPDADGDALGVPSGSGKKDAEADVKFAADAAQAQADAAAEAAAAAPVARKRS